MLRFSLLETPGAVYIDSTHVEAVHAKASRVGDSGVAIKLVSGAEILVEGDLDEVVMEIAKHKDILMKKAVQ